MMDDDRWLIDRRLRDADWRLIDRCPRNVVDRRLALDRLAAEGWWSAAGTLVVASGGTGPGSATFGVTGPVGSGTAATVAASGGVGPASAASGGTVPAGSESAESVAAFRGAGGPGPAGLASAAKPVAAIAVALPGSAGFGPGWSGPSRAGPPPPSAASHKARCSFSWKISLYGSWFFALALYSWAGRDLGEKDFGPPSYP